MKFKKIDGITILLFFLLLIYVGTPLWVGVIIGALIGYNNRLAEQESKEQKASGNDGKDTDSTRNA